ncbi:MoaD/ThiS family protein [Caulobacter sp. 73W]|uniref:MoaD/ThiS family protein n=1 Tax=Caulobacter sp. 73W TaxID=3161137 RepID=A0AB39KXB9_9CAUL
MMRVLLFGRLGDVAGWRERVLEAPPVDLAALRAGLSAEDPRLGEALDGPGVQAAVDQVLVRGSMSLHGVAEVAFLPPMSGG